MHMLNKKLISAFKLDAYDSECQFLMHFLRWKSLEMV